MLMPRPKALLVYLQERRAFARTGLARIKINASEKQGTELTPTCFLQSVCSGRTINGQQ
jgi:hypothetical protein